MKLEGAAAGATCVKEEAVHGAHEAPQRAEHSGEDGRLWLGTVYKGLYIRDCV